jgi:hypothetical protein
MSWFPHTPLVSCFWHRQHLIPLFLSPFLAWSLSAARLISDAFPSQPHVSLLLLQYIEMNLDGQRMAGPYPFYPGNTGQLDYVSMAFDDVNKVFYMLGGMYSKTYVGASGFVAR